MKNDIECRIDIECLIDLFYKKVNKDETISFIFSDIININWDHHIQIIVDFWESILLDNPVYKNNAMAVHYDLNKKINLKKEYFEKWLYLFYSSLDELFAGKNVELAKKRAKSIADVMFFKMNNLHNENNLKIL